MARVKRAVNAHKKRRVVLERASGYRGQRSRLYRKAKEQQLHSMTYAYTDRKDRKGAFRRLWIQRINAAGGKLGSASGVNEDQYLPAAKLGVCKVNIDTDGRLVWCGIHREAFRDDPANFDLRPPGKTFMKAYADYIIHKNQKLGSAGQLECVRQSLK